MKLRSNTGYGQQGLSLSGFIFVLIILALLAVVGMKVVPTVVEFMAIKKAISTAKASGTTAKEIQDSFEKQRTTAYIDSVSSKDLEIIKTADGFEVSIAYEKRIPLVGPASLLIDYAASTSKTPVTKSAQ
jgi:Na+-transporting methylmalonyl-CoA/oxaloacetate decarboxylase gamma subunit